jgi:hypothetical protein
VLDRLICYHRKDIKPATRIATTIHHELEAIFPLLDKICRRTCPWCPDPCCIVTKVWYDFIDLVFLHLIEVPLPPGPLAYQLEEPCRYLSTGGCTLPRLIRPWGCIQYICPTQRKNVHRRKPDDEARLDLALKKIREKRYQLETQFQRAMVCRAHIQA